MNSSAVQVLCDVHCRPGSVPPRYRIFVQGELFTERTWIWTNHYLEECLQISAPPGQYDICFEFIDASQTSKFKVKKPRIAEGRAEINSNLRLTILP